MVYSSDRKSSEFFIFEVLLMIRGTPWPTATNFHTSTDIRNSRNAFREAAHISRQGVVRKMHRRVASEKQTTRCVRVLAESGGENHAESESRLAASEPGFERFTTCAPSAHSISLEIHSKTLKINRK